MPRARDSASLALFVTGCAPPASRRLWLPGVLDTVLYVIWLHGLGSLHEQAFMPRSSRRAPTPAMLIEFHVTWSLGVDADTAMKTETRRTSQIALSAPSSRRWLDAWLCLLLAALCGMLQGCLAAAAGAGAAGGYVLGRESERNRDHDRDHDRDDDK